MKIINSIILFLLLLLSLSVQAKESWICTEASSQRVGTDIHSCGIGLGRDEAEARLKAFDSAKAEFNKVCDSSDDCKSHEVTVDPKRTTCEQLDSSFKCYRMIVFSIQVSLKREKVAVIQQQTQLYKTSADVKVIDAIEPARNENGQVVKLKKGLKKSEVIAMFGKPNSAEGDDGFFGGNFSYGESKFCSFSCMVWFGRNGRVASWSSFHPEYTSDLDDRPERPKAIKNTKRTPVSNLLNTDFDPDAFLRQTAPHGVN